MKVWMLVFLFSVNGNGQTSAVIDNLPTSDECQRIAVLMKETNKYSDTRHRCIEYWKVK